MYDGEVSVVQTDLETFLGAAEELEIKGRMRRLILNVRKFFSELLSYSFFHICDSEDRCTQIFDSSIIGEIKFYSSEVSNYF